jgi:hypothetical protein
MDTDGENVDDSQMNSKIFSVDYNNSELNEGDIKDDIVKPETIALNLTLYNLLAM